MNKTELLEYMKKIVDENVEMYKSDFDIDKEILKTWIDRTCWGAWLVRDHGTQLARFTNAVESMTWVDAVYEQMRVLRAFIITKNGEDYEIRETDLGEIRKRYNNMDRYRIEFFGTPDYRCKIRDVVGSFDSSEKADDYGRSLAKKMVAQSWKTTAL